MRSLIIAALMSTAPFAFAKPAVKMKPGTIAVATRNGKIKVFLAKTKSNMQRPGLNQFAAIATSKSAALPLANMDGRMAKRQSTSTDSFFPLGRGGGYGYRGGYAGGGFRGGYGGGYRGGYGYAGGGYGYGPGIGWGQSWGLDGGFPIDYDYGIQTIGYGGRNWGWPGNGYGYEGYGSALPIFAGVPYDQCVGGYSLPDDDGLGPWNVALYGDPDDDLY